MFQFEEKIPRNETTNGLHINPYWKKLFGGTVPPNKT